MVVSAVTLLVIHDGPSNHTRPAPPMFPGSMDIGKAKRAVCWRDIQANRTWTAAGYLFCMARRPIKYDADVPTNTLLALTGCAPGHQPASQQP
jgi:hypothetical protein